MIVVIVLALVAVISVAVIASTTRQPGAEVEETVPFDPVRPDLDPPPDEP